MKTDGKTHRVKLITGLIYRDVQNYLTIKPILLRLFGPMDYESPEIDFGPTNYYKQEFGPGLKRKFLSFSGLIDPSKLAEIKATTNKLEFKFSSGSKRTVNIDPGYLDMAKLVLASTKDFCHRIYISKGIFAEVTLVYRKNSFDHWDWTYPDYRTAEYKQIFNDIRKIYESQMRPKHG